MIFKKIIKKYFLSYYYCRKYNRKFINIYDDPIIGSNCNIGEFVEISGGQGSTLNSQNLKNNKEPKLRTYNTKVHIGDNVRIGSGTFIPPNVCIKDNVFIGPRVVFTNDKNAPSNGEWKFNDKTIIENNVSIGANSTILPSIRIGENAIIGAGSVVTKDVKANSIVCGNPAKELKK